MIFNKLPVKKLVEFRRLSEKRQLTFINKLRIPKEPSQEDGGGDYWKRSSSGLSNAFKYNDPTIIQEKIEMLAGDYELTKNKNTKIMYKRNLEILHNYEDFDFSILRPSSDLNFLSKPKILLTLDNLPIQVIPHHVFTYGGDGQQHVGGIWFVTWLSGFNLGDLGIFAEALFKYLNVTYSDQYKIDPKYCLTVDTLTKETVNYHEILEGKVPSLFQSTIDTIRNYAC